ncbi:4-hydroxybenzoate polyprenyltransferase [Rhodovulum sp. ES.010]|uniref:UbiA family prenyltransferase n=1 Tax=Rhodovulum sp. ES.010 TaxID=1882821 RepID=UPI000927B970|nr:UbiA family prenyltransferase [Rhodovulum sp. ES.010]SIO53942.1 4-hydroxybenzoate polyprenyltransferase [Rhodovulum sp. ES.010]
MGPGEPLVLDVERSFLATELALEAFWSGLHRAPRATLVALLRHAGQPAALRRALTRIAPPRVDLLPVRPEAAARARAARAAGCEVVLVSDADPALLAALAAHHGLSCPFWPAQGRGGRCGDAPKVPARPAAREGRPRWSRRALLHALRPHQWVKNLLLLLPVLAAHAFSTPILLLALAGIVAFSAAASSIYIVNDLLDLEADRLHPVKRNRPFAAGAVPIGTGMAASLGLAFVAFALGAALGPAFLGVLGLYMVLSLAYSLRLKRMRWVDVATLAALYTLRVVAGAAATGVGASVLMLVFVFPVFLALGCVKRMTELALAEDGRRLPGRGYGRADRDDLLNMAGLGVVAALLVFFGYSFTDQARALYPSRWMLWVALLPLAAWLVRMVVLGYRGAQDYDPILFAVRDRVGLGLIFLALCCMFHGAGLWQRGLGV